MKFLTGEPALLLEKQKALVISDLHLGIEHEFYRSGIRVPSQAEKMRGRIERLLKITKAKRLIILGDVKHKVPGLSWQELREVPEFISRLNKRIPAEILPGNHDPGLRGLVPGIRIHPSRGLLLGDSYLLHGHTWPSEAFLGARHVIMGHNHPVIEFRDRLGHVWREPAWVRTVLDKGKISKEYGKIPKPLPELIIMPVFNGFAGGIPINSGGNGFMGPLGRCADRGKSGIYLLDGTFLGMLAKL